jgi:hypothetical protein
MNPMRALSLFSVVIGMSGDLLLSFVWLTFAWRQIAPQVSTARTLPSQIDSARFRISRQARVNRWMSSPECQIFDI